MTVTRRTVLAALGTAVATAGCFGQGRQDPGGGPGTESDAPTDTPGETPTETADQSPSEPPQGTNGGPFSDLACPSFTETDRTVCWHGRSGDAPVVLEPEDTAFRPVDGNNTIETFEFTLRNRSEEAFGLNPYAWQLQVHEDGEWTHVAPDEWIEPWHTVEPGETFKWILATERHPTPGGADDKIHVIEDLDPGTYAFAVHGNLGAEADDAESIECIARFAVEDVVAAEN